MGDGISLGSNRPDGGRNLRSQRSKGSQHHRVIRRELSEGTELTARATARELDLIEGGANRSVRLEHLIERVLENNSKQDLVDVKVELRVGVFSATIKTLCLK